MQALANLKSLRDDMKQKNHSICSFLFKYKRTTYIVLVKRFVGKEKKKSKYALVKLQFIQDGNLKNEFTVEANSNRLLTSIKKLREYFKIEHGENSGDILEQFSRQLGKQIPTEMVQEPTKSERKAIIRSLSKSDSTDPQKIYCCGIRRNMEGCRRTIYNSDKAYNLRPNLYEYFANDLSISFCFSDDKSKEATDNEIIKSFAKKEN